MIARDVIHVIVHAFRELPQIVADTISDLAESLRRAGSQGVTK